MTNAAIARVTGMRDLFSTQIASRQQVETALAHSFELYGYAPVALPLVEHSELYLRRSGENIISQMYEFNHRGRRLCLRPEITASVMRAYIEHLQDAPLPARLYYAGPVFRYAGPPHNGHRQFTQIGLELIGAEGALADGEVIHAACAALEAAGVENYRLLLGHMGILSAFLGALDIDAQLRSFLLLNMETLRQRGQGYVAERLSELYPAFNPSAAETPKSAASLVNVLRDMQAEAARELVVELLESLNLRLDENRDRDEITERLLAKLRRGDQTAALNTALAFMSQLGQLKGEPRAVLSACEELLSEHNVNRDVIEYINRLVALLDALGAAEGRVSLDLGITLGFQYYTGMIFEIYHAAPGADSQLCGGGRYDDLIGLLGGSQSQPATGFSFDLEAVCQALAVEKGADAAFSGQQPQIFIAGTDENSLARAAQTAQTVRASGLRAELGLQPVTLASGLAYASQRQIPLVAIVDGQAPASVTVHELRAHREYTLSLDDLPAALQRIGNQYDYP